MLENIEKQKHGGMFNISSDKEIRGELTLDGPRSSLQLWDRQYDHLHDMQSNFIKGVLNDLTKVSLLDCIKTGGVGIINKENDRISFRNLFPHYVLLGDEHISPQDKLIIGVKFVIDDANQLFHEKEIFGQVINPVPLFEHIVRCENDFFKKHKLPYKQGKIEVGPIPPQIYYYTGKEEIFSADTVLGKISAFHSPTFRSTGGSDGIEVKNKIFVELGFCNAITFKEAMDRTFRVFKFLELIIGRPQNNLELWISKKGEEKKLTEFRVYESMSPKRGRSENEREVHPTDILINVAGYPNEFSQILADWLERDDLWRNSRNRFFGNFYKHRDWDVDRLIAAANMFDILPGNAVPRKVELEENIKHVRDCCIMKFKSLPRSPERDRALGDLGRIGSVNLKKKIHHRAKLLIDKIGDKLPYLLKATDEAVNCRNLYVHGTSPLSGIDYDKESHILFFLTDTLEFVFAASDLIDAGWDIEKWCKDGGKRSHPFGQYLADYESNISKLISLFESSK